MYLILILYEALFCFPVFWYLTNRMVQGFNLDFKKASCYIYKQSCWSGHLYPFKVYCAFYICNLFLSFTNTHTHTHHYTACAHLSSEETLGSVFCPRTVLHVDRSSVVTKECRTGIKAPKISSSPRMTDS